MNSDLQEALDALANVREWAAEDGCDEPSDLAIANADTMLRAMYNMSPRVYDVYAMGDGEVVIDGMGLKCRRVGVFCYNDGRVQVVGWKNGMRDHVSDTGITKQVLYAVQDVLMELDEPLAVVGVSMGCSSMIEQGADNA